MISSTFASTMIYSCALIFSGTFTSGGVVCHHGYQFEWMNAVWWLCICLRSLNLRRRHFIGKKINQSKQNWFDRILSIWRHTIVVTFYLYYLFVETVKWCAYDPYFLFYMWTDWKKITWHLHVFNFNKL